MKIKVTHVEAWNKLNEIPSSAFCCLYRLMLLKLSGNVLKNYLFLVKQVR